jgi:chemotaxis protein CheZ
MPDAVLATVSAIADRLSSISGRFPGAQPELVADVVRAVLGMSDDDPDPTETSLIAEVEELGRTIASAKAEIAALRVDDITDNHIPSATDELDAIVAHTAAATDQILETCETLDRVAGELTGEAAAQLQDATTRIYEACGFQDITGQRITKVVATLKTIEAKVAHMVAAFGTSAGRPAKADAMPDPSLLLHGPQLPAAAMDQSDIDKLLASFD